MSDETKYGVETFEKKLIVSYDTKLKLIRYAELLSEWNQKFNLVAAGSLPQIWVRHFLDSAQLMAYIPETAQNLADMGSGAGFPGLVLAIMAQDKQRSIHVTCIEITGKKADFLQVVIDDLKLNVTVRRERIESIRDLKADVVTARALKLLPELLPYANHLIHKNTVCLFLKGRNAGEELTQARKYWTFDLQTYPSLSDDSGTVLELKQLRYKTRR